jgi:hypothetical protein
VLAAAAGVDEETMMFTLLDLACKGEVETDLERWRLTRPAE